MFDVAIIGGGISGFSCAHRLQSKGLKTIVIEGHGQLGGCAGFYSKKGFSFDVGATTLVDFVENGVGGNYFKDIGLALPQGEYLDYVAWLPDRKVTLYRDRKKWHKERLEKIGNTKDHIQFWKFLDRITDVFWEASRKGIKLPLQSIGDVVRAIQCIGFKNIPLAFYFNVTMLDVLKKYNLHNDKPLCGLLSMLIEDTVHSTIDKAPFINATLGTTIRGAGLMRAKGGMKAFWNYVTKDYLEKGGTVKRGTKVQAFFQKGNKWILETSKGSIEAQKVISSLPIESTHKIAPNAIQNKLSPHIQKNKELQGGAIVIFLGVKDSNVANQALTHHQLLQDYDTPLGNGNNMFISISAEGDTLSAPAGHRAVMISTHCQLQEWMHLSEEAYLTKKMEIGKQLIEYAQRVYPNIADTPIIYEVGTPRTYQKFTQRINGSVGGYKQTLSNTNLRAVPHDIGIENFWILGDTTWPGLGTVAGLVGSQIVSEMLLKLKREL